MLIRDNYCTIVASEYHGHGTNYIIVLLYTTTTTSKFTITILDQLALIYCTCKTSYCCGYTFTTDWNYDNKEIQRSSFL